MMLITLEHFAEVPAKIHLFYEHAFEALFGRHDVTKGGFQRKRHTTLALDDFKRLFAYFCMITYIKDQKAFTGEKVLETIQLSITSSQILVDKVLYRNDLTESTCMLAREGLDYSFSHRSFQEYFAAYFLSRVKADEFERALPQIVQRASFDNVLKMVSEMNKENFEEMWALPTLQFLCNRTRDIDARKDCVKFASRLFGTKLNLTIDRSQKSFNVLLVDLPGKKQAPQKDPALLRRALYHVFDVFKQIHEACGPESESTDVQVIQKIAESAILPKDARFDEFRTSKKEKHGDWGPIPLKGDDCVWLRDTHFGRFMIAESKLLPKLRDEMARRVGERRRGFSEIFPR